MKVVLVTLSGAIAVAHSVLKTRYQTPLIVDLPRSVLETGSLGERLRTIRAERPALFAIMTESLDWQYGQLALMLFGSLVGARESLIVDASGRVRSGTRFGSIFKFPIRIAAAYLRGWLGVRRAKKDLARLEREIKTGPEKSWQRENGGSASIAYLRATPAPGTQPGGATSHINGVVKALTTLGARVSFISNDDIAGLDKNKVAFHKIRPDPDIMPRSAFDICNGVKFSERAAEIIMTSPPAFIYQRYVRFSCAGVEASLRRGVPLFLEYNGSEVWIGRHWDRTEKLDLLERYERLNLAAATRVFVISEVEKNNLLAVGIPGEKIIVNPNGVDTDVFRPDIGGQDERTGFAIDDNTTLVGFVGSFGPWHGVLTLADAIALVSRDVDIKFLLIGDGSLRGEVERRLSASGNLDRVIFTGTVEHDRVPVLLDACDILVSPHVPLAEGTEFFGSPTKLFEYMAMGKGIVASRLGQIVDVLEDGANALLVEPGSADELSEAIVKITADRDKLNAMGRAARAIVVERHTWLINARRVLEELNAIS